MSIRYGIFGLILAVALAGGRAAAGDVATGVPAAWPIYHGDSALSGVARTVLPDKLAVMWRYRAEAGVSVPPVTGSNMVFFVSEDGCLNAITLQGKKAWSRRIEKDSAPGAGEGGRARKFATPPLFIRGTVVTGSDDGWLHALNSIDGKTLWKYRAGQSINGTANWVEQGDGGCSILVISQWDGIVHCIDLATGKGLWKSQEVGECDGSPGVGSDFVAFGGCDMTFHVLSAATGKAAATVELGQEGQVAGGTAVCGDLVFAGTYNGTVACADVRKKIIVWTNRVAKAEAFATPAIAWDRIVTGSHDGFVYCLEKTSGRKLWSFEAGDTVLSPVIADDKVVVSSGGTLYVLKLRDGARLWSAKAGDRVSSPAVVDGAIIVGTDDGFVVMYGAGSATK